MSTIKLDGRDIAILEEYQKNIIKNDIPYDIFDSDIRRRLRWVLRDAAIYERSITVDGEELFADPATFSEYTEERKGISDEEIISRIQWVLNEKITGCSTRLFHEWVRTPYEVSNKETKETTKYFNKLVANGVMAINFDIKQLSELIFSQDNTKLCVYKCRKTRYDDELFCSTMILDIYRCETLDEVQRIYALNADKINNLYFSLKEQVITAWKKTEIIINDKIKTEEAAATVVVTFNESIAAKAREEAAKVIEEYRAAAAANAAEIIKDLQKPIE